MLTFRETSSRSDRIAQWSYESLREHVEAYSSWLAAHCEDSSCVAIRMEATGQSIAALLAAETRSMPAILVPPSLPSGETQQLLDSLQPAALFEQTKTHLGESPWTILGDDHASGRGWPRPIIQSFICQLTSGSLGPSRLALRSSRAVSVEIEAIAKALTFVESDRVLTASSLSHSYGLIGGVLASLVAGSHVILSTDPGDIALLMERVKPTIVFGISSTYVSLLKQRIDPHLLTECRFALSAGAPLPVALFADFKTTFHTPIRQDYGTTETGTISIDRDDDPIPESVGRPLDHLEVGISENTVPQNVTRGEGEILIRSVATASHLLEGHRVVPSLDQDGWYHTGDLGQRMANGALRVSGRIRPPIEVAGNTVPLEVVEEGLQNIPGVLEAVAVPILSPTGRPRAKAVLVAPGIDHRTMDQAVRKSLPHLYPVLSIEIVEELPKSPAGKILQKYLV